MWQRVQTLFLLGTFVLLITSLFFPIYEAEVMLKHVEQTPMHLKTYTGKAGAYILITEKFTWYYAALLIVSAVLALFSITRFKNRILQMKIGAVNSLIMCAYLAIVVFQTWGDVKNIYYGLGFYLPVAAVISNILANRFIKKDEELVRSADRIR